MDEKSKEALQLITEALAKSSQSQVNLVIVNSFNGAQHQEGWFDRLIAGIETRSFKIGFCVIGFATLVAFVSYKLDYPLPWATAHASSISDSNSKSVGHVARRKTQKTSQKLPMPKPTTSTLSVEDHKADSEISESPQQ